MAKTYVIQVLTGHEAAVILLIEKLLSGEQAFIECFAPRFELKKRIQGEWQLVSELLTPGYIYLETNNIDRVSQELYHVPAFTRLLGNNGKFIPLNKDEMQWLHALTRPGTHTVEMSEGVIEGDQIIVNEGPLKGLEATIKKIDRHKRLAYLDMRFFDRPKLIKVGLEIVRKNV